MTTATKTVEKKTMKALRNLLREEHGVKTGQVWEYAFVEWMPLPGMRFYGDDEEGPRVVRIAESYGYELATLMRRWERNGNGEFCPVGWTIDFCPSFDSD